MNTPAILNRMTAGSFSKGDKYERLAAEFKRFMWGKKSGTEVWSPSYLILEISTWQSSKPLLVVLGFDKTSVYVKLHGQVPL